MTMTVAGPYRVPYEEAEVLKTTPEKEKEIFPVIKATVEKMASITEKFLKGYEIPAVYVVGGSASFQEFTSVFEKKLNLPVYRRFIPFWSHRLESLITASFHKKLTDSNNKKLYRILICPKVRFLVLQNTIELLCCK